MAAGNSVNDEIREQQRKLKGKPFKEKWAYFWEYYKIHTIVTVAVTAAAISLVHTIVSQKDSALDVALVNTFLKEDYESEQVAADFEAYAQIDTEEYQVVIDPDLYVDYEGTDQYSYANLQKLSAMAAARVLDVVLTNDDYIDHNSQSGMFTDLHDFFTEEELSRYEDRLLYRDLPEDGKGEVPIGIDVRDSKYMLSDQIPAWFCIISSSEKADTAKLFLQFLLEP